MHQEILYVPVSPSISFILKNQLHSWEEVSLTIKVYIKILTELNFAMYYDTNQILL